MNMFETLMRKTVVCIVLATIMVVSGVLPSMASNENDLSRWVVGNKNTITGNPTDGWDIVLGNGSVFDVNEFASYEFEGQASELKITLDLSKMGDQELFIHLGYEPSNVYRWHWDGYGATFAMKNRNNALRVYRHTGGKESVHAVFENFDFTVPHVFEFLQDDNDEYHLAVDGTLCLTPWADSDEWDTSVDAYITQGGVEESVVVSFTTIGTVETLALNDVMIERKEGAVQDPSPTETPAETPTEAPTEAPTEDPTEAPSADAGTPTDDSQGNGDGNAAGIIIGIVVIILIVAAVVVIVFVKKKKK